MKDEFLKGIAEGCGEGAASACSDGVGAALSGCASGAVEGLLACLVRLIFGGPIAAVLGFFIWAVVVPALAGPIGGISALLWLVVFCFKVVQIAESSQKRNAH